jgi:lipoprotein-releasing system permease protein
LLGDGVYFINFIPSDLQLVDVIATYFLAIVLCVLATLYPAHKAANVDPATSLA